MDHIDKIMRKAKAAGYGASYGKYMAENPQPPHQKVPERPKHPARACKECGEIFTPNRADQMYCNDDCRHKYNVKRKLDRERYKNKTKMPLGEAKCRHCGGTFNRYKGTMEYCSRSCAAFGRNEERRKLKRETSSDG